ncbi:MAG: phosphatase, partial [Butyricicoccus sp.]
NNGVVTGELIAEAALDEPYNQRHPLLAPYRPGGARSDNPYLNFYWDYCAPGKPAYVPIRYMHAREAIHLIHACGGVAVLAHPGAGKGCDRALVEQLIGYGLEGIEVHSNYHTAEQTEKYAEIAQANGLLTTCGSDFHGKTKPAISLGKPLCSQSGELAEGLKKSIRRRKIVEYPRKMKE